MNAKEEFLRAIKGCKVIGAEVSFSGPYNKFELNETYILPLL